MEMQATQNVAAAYGAAWRLKGRLLIAHLATVVLFAALLAPAVALAMRGAVALSGQSALTDQEIAAFLLSPFGAVAMLGVAALFLTVQVIGLSVKMALLASDQSAGIPEAFRLVLAQAPRILRFAVALVLRILARVLPVLAACGLVAYLFLGAYDINFYLTQRPPEFLIAAGLIAVLLAGLLAVLIPRLLGWAVALPLVLFEAVSPRLSFVRSEALMTGRRTGLAWRLALWGLATLALAIVAAAVVGVIARAAATGAGDDVARLALRLVAASALLAGLNFLVAALSSGALAHLLLDAAGWPRVTPPEARRRSAAWGVGLAALVVLGLVTDGLVAPRIAAPTDVVVIAHRGGAVARPENTMAAMRHGIDQGADWLEIDVQESAEGEIIVFHDSDFMKLSGDPIKTWEVTSDDIDRLDIGSWFSPDYADERVPRLSEVLAAADGQSRVLIELKYYGHQVALEERVAEIVEAAGMTDQIAAMSLSREGAARMKALRPDWQVGVLAATAIGRLDRIEADFLAVNSAIATPRLIRQARAAGKPVHVWTLNDATSMAAMAMTGAAGLITDRPALARSVLDDLAALSAAERLALVLGDRLGLQPPAAEMRDASP
jgi:glycerophosphoryl diester phosphodiesterase